MNVLVIGAGGMVGSHMVEILHSQDHHVVGTYHERMTNIREIDPAISVVKCGVCHPFEVEKIITKEKPDVIYHLAAQSYPTVSWDKPFETIETNVNGTVAVFEAVKKVRAEEWPDYDPMVVVACSSAEYGETLNHMEGDTVYVREDAPLLPLHPYGVPYKVGKHTSLQDKKFGFTFSNDASEAAA